MAYASVEQPLLLHRFAFRLIGNAIAAILLLGGSLAIGMWGYHHFEHLLGDDPLGAGRAPRAARVPSGGPTRLRAQRTTRFRSSIRMIVG
jgi:hypothetical protein